MKGFILKVNAAWITVVVVGLAFISTPVTSRSLRARRIVQGPPAVQIPRAEQPPRIDGTLNDPSWKKAAMFENFKTLHPEAGKNPSEHTAVYLTYDHENIYLGARLFDSEPAKIRAQSTKRDDPGGDDWVAFCLDSMNDELGAVFFLVTPNGTQVDGTLNAGGSPNTEFDTQWTSAATRTADGWIATMAIPFKRLPFHWADHVVMSFKVARNISRKSEEVDFPEISPNRAHLAQFQPIEFNSIERGLTEIPQMDIEGLRQRKLKLNRLPDISNYDRRVTDWGDASVFDYLVFPSRELKPAGKPFHFAKALNSHFAADVENIEYLPGKKIGTLDTFLQRNLTTSFIVIKDDKILYENYFNGYSRDSIVTSFSVAKSFDSTLVGIAIDEGLIKSVNDPITKYLPELAKRDERFTRITIKDLMMMSSGLRYEEDDPHYDNRLTYLYPDLRRLALEKTEIVEIPGKWWLYNNYNPLLIGMILERVTGKTVTQYLQEKIWGRLGMEYAGSWSLNAADGGLEKMESGINARAIDFAKFGRLLLNDGRFQDRQVVSSTWVEQATQPEDKPTDYYHNDPFFVSQGHYYKYFWWGSRRPGGKNDFYGVGNKGQYIYVSPQKHLIIVRNGIDFSLPSIRWVSLYYQIADAVR